ncbi:hypothetical protein N7451_003045 [Penicillium sp. IBT 35674x]|nr:hypothetical protein N7451_003045 [Penicillium sp. IBT 35674x]
MYVNVYLQPSDSNMSDFMLLHTMLSHIERSEHTLTLGPEMTGRNVASPFTFLATTSRRF